MSFFFKTKIIRSSFIGISVGLCSQNSWAATSLMVSGHAGLVGQSSWNTPPVSSDYSSFRVPIGLTLQASPTDNFNLYLGLEYAYNNYPGPSVLLGQTTATSGTSNYDGSKTPMPFSDAISGSTPYGQKTDTPTLTQAYFTYQTPIGLLKAGRMPRNWGLGVWYNDEWTPYGGLISSSDAVAIITDFNLFDIGIFYEKYGESVGGTSRDGDASAFTIQARLKADPADTPSSGMSREFGVLYSRFNHKLSNTSLSTLDVYGKFYFSNFYAGSEFLYPTGSTQSPNYQSLGGAAACQNTTTDILTGSQTCTSQSVSSMAALLKMKLQLNNEDNSSIAATEKAQNLLSTIDRETSHVISMWLGYASGGSNQFNDPNSLGGDNKVTAIQMNSNIQPSFLMFNNTMPAVSGMPGGAITNTTFVRFDYVYENPNFGSIGPVLVSGWLNHLNDNYNAQNSLCSQIASVNPESATNRLCVGGSNSLGQELDLNYKYTTQDHVTFGADLGYWLVGKAWQIYGQSTPSASYGMRISLATQF